MAATVGKNRLLVVTPPAQQLRQGDKIHLQLRPDRIHLFDGASQLAL